ncbi:SURF1 family protein [Sphingomonas sp. KC8]|uniref:SURF1 family protein n=1 Tax=Sphingomonas sp. KC8 TaxID=1030157 RepID=UPI001110A990|nr:SURF1 family protein [Sphingomonas sp. KC8]
MVAALIGLGLWQVDRLAWKQQLIASIDTRIHAAPVAAPGPDEWPAIKAASHAYRRVEARGSFLHAQTSFVQAATARGSGFWVMTPLATDRGFTILVNRGFVPPEARAAIAGMRTAEPAGVTGLLRITEPGGGFLRRNDPAAGRWYSRDVAAIATAQRIDHAAPYFIDAAANPDPAALPVSGLTVISFPNHHLGYALTWFTLAAMVIGGYMLLMRDEIRLRRAQTRS